MHGTLSLRYILYYPGMDLLGGVHTPLALARGGAGGGAIFHDKAKKLLETK
jgi:hypothetical protein